MDKITELEMTFDQWIDAVNAQVHARLGDAVRTTELSWDSAMWVTAQGTAVAALADDGTTAKLSFDGGDKLSLPFQQADAAPELLSATIAEHLSR
jgi:hypothetical protein